VDGGAVTMERWTELTRMGPESVTIGGRTVRRGSRVVLRPRSKADVLARALDGRRAVVDAVETDLDDNVQLAVVVEDDPARDLGKARSLAHRFFFAPDEIEPLPETGRDAPPRRILVAGIGNVFLGDDGFGVEVVRRLARCDLPAGVNVVDFGIRGFDLAYALADGYDAALLIDAAPRGETPGTLVVIEPEIDEAPDAPIEAHGMDPEAVLRLARRFGRVPRRTLIVGCEPEVLGDPQGLEIVAELSASVGAAVDRAVDLVRSLLGELVASNEEGGDV
jgi:hydrogenase maturation protease